MTVFNEIDHPRAAVGTFTEKVNSAPETGLLEQQPPTPTGFWKQIDHQLGRIRDERADTFAAVADILKDPEYGEVQQEISRNGTREFGVKSAFFAGSGGEDTLYSALRDSGWKVSTVVSSYQYTVRYPETGEELEYIEGDVYDRTPGYAPSR